MRCLFTLLFADICEHIAFPSTHGGNFSESTTLAQEHCLLVVFEPRAGEQVRIHSGEEKLYPYFSSLRHDGLSRFSAIKIYHVLQDSMSIMGLHLLCPLTGYLQQPSSECQIHFDSCHVYLILTLPPLRGAPSLWE